jgi:hypothetical protein
MSRGYGIIQRAIVAVFEAEPDNAFLLSELCERVYRGGINRIEKKHRVAVARAAYRIPWLAHMKRQTLGCEVVFYNSASVLAYGMARLKSHNFSRYERHSDPRFRWKEPRSEADLRAMLAPGGDHHKYVVEGGAWWRSAKMKYAKCSGDDETYQRLKDEEDKELTALTESIREAFAHAAAKPQRPERPPIAGYELRIGYENGDTRVLDFASRRKANHMADHMALRDGVCFCEIQRLYAGMREI